jgi:hypothetical protein
VKKESAKMTTVWPDARVTLRSESVDGAVKV